MIDVSLVVAVIVGVVEAIKRTGYVAPRFSAVLAIALGIAFSHLFGEGDAMVRVFEGLMAGLMAAGLYSGAKAALK
jgi:hypothetical protein